MGMNRRNRGLSKSLLLAALPLLLAGCGTTTGTKEDVETDAANEVIEETAVKELEQTERNTEEEQQEEPQTQEEDTPVWSSVSILGDSISTFSGWIPEGYYDFFPDNGVVETVEETWWYPLLEELDLTLYTNASSAGATCVGDSTSEDNPSYGCSDFRINALEGENGVIPDVIIVYMGTNDLLTGVPLGDNDGTQLVNPGEVENFSDAYTMMLDKLQAEYPCAELFCCTLTQIGDWGTETPFVEFTNSDGLTAADYNACITKIANNLGARVIDLYDCGITIENMQETVSDGVHPTPEGMVYVREAVKKALTE